MENVILKVTLVADEAEAPRASRHGNGQQTTPAPADARPSAPPRTQNDKEEEHHGKLYAVGMAGQAFASKARAIAAPGYLRGRAIAAIAKVTGKGVPAVAAAVAANAALPVAMAVAAVHAPDAVNAAARTVGRAANIFEGATGLGRGVADAAAGVAQDTAAASAALWLDIDRLFGSGGEAAQIQRALAEQGQGAVWQLPSEIPTSAAAWRNAIAVLKLKKIAEHNAAMQSIYDTARDRRFDVARARTATGK